MRASDVSGILLLINIQRSLKFPPDALMDDLKSRAMAIVADFLQTGDIASDAGGRSARTCGWASFFSTSDPRRQSCPNVLHERGNLHELDARAYTVETGYSLEELIGEECFGCVL